VTSLYTACFNISDIVHPIREGGKRVTSVAEMSRNIEVSSGGAPEEKNGHIWWRKWQSVGYLMSKIFTDFRRLVTLAYDTKCKWTHHLRKAERRFWGEIEWDCIWDWKAIVLLNDRYEYLVIETISLTSVLISRLKELD
jgi:hypothetical protein